MKLSTKRRTLIINGVLVVLLLGGIAAAWASVGGDSSGDGAAPLTTRVTRGTVLASVSASGSVESARTRALDFSTAGTVESVLVESGDKVKKGQVLARIDDTAARESLEAAKASLDAAEEADTSTASGYSQYISARNAYRSAERAVAGTVIKAPFAGVVTAVNGAVGGSSGASGGSGGSSKGGQAQSQSGSAGSSGTGGSSGFIEIADPAHLRIVGNFTEADVSRIKVGQAATVSFDALTGVTAAGKVTVVDPQPQTNNNVVQYAATISLTGVPSTVRLGQTATVQVTVGKADDVLTVASSAVTTAGGQTTVTVLENGRQVVKRVEVGLKGDITTEIKSGLQEGDQVVRPQASTTGGGGIQFPGGGGGFGRGFGGGGGGRGGNR